MNVPYLSAVEAVSKEVLINTETVITCKISEITEQMSVTWSGFTTGDVNYIQEQGGYDSSSNTQTSTLTVKSPAVVADNTYTCTVSSVKFPMSDKKSLNVALDVYGKGVRY